MKILHFSTLFVSLIALNASAQLEIDKAERLLLSKKDSLGFPSAKGYIQFAGDFYVNSNAISNQFLGDLIYKRAFIDEGNKNDASDRLKKNNRLGADGYLGVQGVYQAKKLRYTFGVGQRVVASAKFSDDLFELMFRGNAQYAGQSVDLSKTAITYFDYKNIYLGIQKKLKGDKITVGASAAFLLGGNYQQFTMKSTSLFTEQTGDYIDLNGDLSYHRGGTDSTRKNYGKGASINLFFSVNHKKNVLSFEVRDLGVMAWTGIKTYTGDSTYRYGGLLINELLAPDASLVSSVKLDSIASLVGINRATENITMFLPTVFHLNYVLSPNKRFSRTVGVRYMLIPGYIPKIYLRETDFLGKGFTLVNTFSYGGFGRLDYELGLMKKLGQGLLISTNLFAFEYLVLPGRSSGHGLSFGVTKLF